MRKLVFLLTICLSLEISAQNYLITFAGTGDATTVGSVIVENLTAGTSLTLNGDQTLRLVSIMTGINSDVTDESSILKIYPNPMTDNSIIQFYPPKSGNAIITIFDMVGKQIAQTKSYLDSYLQEFRLSGIKSGSYLISIKSNTFQYSGKLLSNGKSNGEIRIEKVSNNKQVLDTKETNLASKGEPGTVDMNYTPGDRLKLTGISGDYSTVLTDIPTGDKTITYEFVGCTDGDNINYPVVTFQVAKGAQTWMAENLKTTKYRNGDLIGTTTPASLDISGETTPKYQWAYNGIESNVAIYGRLYTWYAITDSRSVCPLGWHVPTDTEWSTFITYLGGESVAGGKLKETGTIHWTNPNTGGTNQTGFTALPSGTRDYMKLFSGNQNYESLWSSTEYEYDTEGAWHFDMSYDDTELDKSCTGKNAGLSVRCLKD